MGLLSTMKAMLPARRAGASPAYDAAGSGRRLLGWLVSNPGVNATVIDSVEALRARSRDIVRKNPWAANAVDAFVANAVGSGIKPQSIAEDEGFREETQALWWDWTDEADAASLTDFYGLQALVTRAVLEAGECFVRLRSRRPEDGLTVPLQLQVLEAEHVPVTMEHLEPNGNRVKAGIEFDAIGRRVAYHMYRDHPGETSLFGTAGETVRVPADQVLHVYRPLRPGQLRGVPWLAPVLLKLHELDQYDDAELVRKKTAALFAGFITRPGDDALMGEGEPDEHGAATAGLEPGTLQMLGPGEEVTFSSPADVGANYDTFMRHQLRAIAAGIGITYEQLTGDLEKVNFSSIRAGLLEFRRRCEMLQHAMLVYQMCRPVWRRWMTEAVLAGELQAPGFGRSPRRWLSVKWIPQGWQWVDPKKEMEAIILAIRGGLMSRSEAVSQSGFDAEEIDRELAADNARADALGLVLDSDPRRTNRSGIGKTAAGPAADDETNSEAAA